MFDTPDIVLAATLITLGYKLLAIEKMGMKGIFHFDSIDEQVINDFDCGKILVEPISFNNSIKRLTTAARRAI